MTLGGRFLLLAAVVALVACDEKDDDTGAAGDGGADGGGAGDGGASDGGAGDGGSSVGEIVAWTIDHHLDVCSGEGQWLCPRGKRDGASDWERIGCGIEGLAFQWGTTTELTSEITSFSDPAVDGCGYVFTLVSVDSEVFDGGGASFALDGLYGVMITPAEGGGTLEGGHAFTCAGPAVCDAVAAVVSDWAHVYDLSLRNPETAGEPLVLDGIAESR